MTDTPPPRIGPLPDSRHGRYCFCDMCLAIKAALALKAKAERDLDEIIPRSWWTDDDE